MKNKHPVLRRFMRRKVSVVAAQCHLVKSKQ